MRDETSWRCGEPLRTVRECAPVLQEARERAVVAENRKRLLGGMWAR